MKLINAKLIHFIIVSRFLVLMWFFQVSLFTVRDSGEVRTRDKGKRDRGRGPGLITLISQSN